MPNTVLHRSLLPIAIAAAALSVVLDIAAAATIPLCVAGLSTIIKALVVRHQAAVGTRQLAFEREFGSMLREGLRSAPFRPDDPPVRVRRGHDSPIVPLPLAANDDLPLPIAA